MTEELQRQLEDLAAWKIKQDELFRKLARTLIIGVVLISIGFAGGVWKVTRLSQNNRYLIRQVDNLNREQAKTGYETCLRRNQSANAGLRYLLQLSILNDKVAESAQPPTVKKLFAQTAEVHRNTLLRSGATLDSTKTKLVSTGLPPCNKPANQPIT